MNQTLRSFASVRRRVPTTQSGGAILAGDLLVLFAFIATGQYAHEYFFWEMPIHTLLITIPFVIAWLLVASAAGLFSQRTLRSYKRTLALVIPAWIGASLVGGAIRTTPFFPGGAPPTFLLANIAFGLLFFVPWRLFASWLVQRSGGINEGTR